MKFPLRVAKSQRIKASRGLWKMMLKPELKPRFSNEASHGKFIHLLSEQNERSSEAPRKSDRLMWQRSEVKRSLRIIGKIEILAYQDTVEL